MSPRLFLFAALASAVPAAQSPAHAQAAGPGLTVSVDQARILRIEHAAETIIVGNPGIVDVAIHDASTLILTGRSFGVTNIVVLDAEGETVIDESVTVNALETASVRIYRQAQRTTYACSPNCQPTVTVGDAGFGFENAAAQFSTRESLARGGGQP